VVAYSCSLCPLAFLLAPGVAPGCTVSAPCVCLAACSFPVVVLCCAVLCWVVLCCAVLCCAGLCCAVLCCLVPCRAVCPVVCCCVSCLLPGFPALPGRTPVRPCFPGTRLPTQRTHPATLPFFFKMALSPSRSFSWPRVRCFRACLCVCLCRCRVDSGPFPRAVQGSQTVVGPAGGLDRWPRGTDRIAEVRPQQQQSTKASPSRGPPGGGKVDTRGRGLVVPTPGDDWEVHSSAFPKKS